MTYKNAATFDTLRTVAFGSINSTYTQVGPVLPSPAVIVSIKNATDGIIYISTDGINDMLAIPAGWAEVYDIRTNAPNVAEYFIPQGTSFLIKYSGSAPSSGSVYIEAIIVQS
jgi:hypothetical protein